MYPRPALLTKMFKGPGRALMAAANAFALSWLVRSRGGPHSTLLPGYFFLQTSKNEKKKKKRKETAWSARGSCMVCKHCKPAGHRRWHPQHTKMLTIHAMASLPSAPRLLRADGTSAWHHFDHIKEMLVMLGSLAPRLMGHCCPMVAVESERRCMSLRLLAQPQPHGPFQTSSLLTDVALMTKLV